MWCNHQKIQLHDFDFTLVLSLHAICLKSAGKPTYLTELLLSTWNTCQQAGILFCLSSHVAEIKKQREFYQKLGMEVPGEIKGDLCNMKTHLDQRNGTLHLTRPTSDPSEFLYVSLVWFKPIKSGPELEHELELVFAALLCVLVPSPPLCRFKGLHHPTQAIPAKTACS